MRLVATREAPSFDVDGGENDGVADAVARAIGPGQPLRVAQRVGGAPRVEGQRRVGDERRAVRRE